MSYVTLRGWKFRRVLWEPRDIWVGLYWTAHENSSPPGTDPDVTAYICIIPCLPIIFDRYDR